MSAGAKLAGLTVFAVLYGALAGGVYSLAGGLLGKAGALFWPYSLIALFGSRYALPVSILLGVSGGVAFYVCWLKDRIDTGGHARLAAWTIFAALYAAVGASLYSKGEGNSGERGIDRILVHDAEAIASREAGRGGQSEDRRRARRREGHRTDVRAVLLHTSTVSAVAATLAYPVDPLKVAGKSTARAKRISASSAPVSATASAACARAWYPRPGCSIFVLRRQNGWRVSGD
jgi:hypothetical protein